MSEALSESKLENFIRQAFANTTPPETLTRVEGLINDPKFRKSMGQEYCQNYDIIVSTHTGKTWQELALERLYKDFSAKTILTAETYKYFLPAYMLFIIKDHRKILEKLQDELVRTFINVIDRMPAEKQEIFTAHYKEFITGFTQEQEKAIILFLRYLSKRVGVLWNTGPEAALASLAEAWGDV